MMKRKFISLTMIVLSQVFAVAQSQFAGLCGAELKQYLCDNYSPTAYVERMLGDDGAWSVFAQCDVNADGTVLDRYSNEKYYYPQDKTTAPVGMTVDYVVNQSWWGSRVTDAVKRDLYNILPCNEQVPDNKNDYMPGEVVEPIYANEVWASGWGYIEGYRINMYAPPQGYEGDFARIIMYMATMYPAERWSGQGVNFFADGNYPTLNGYSRNLLLQWHSLDPVSEVERTRNNVISMVQGNCNPFVKYPQLVDYIWGAKSSEPYQPEQDDSEVTKIPLRAVYSISTYSRIDLYSPHIPDDAKWKVNGVEVQGKSVKTESLGVGTHELRFESTIVKGKLKIMITE